MKNLLDQIALLNNNERVQLLKALVEAETNLSDTLKESVLVELNYVGLTVDEMAISDIKRLSNKF